jgi:hypothetical protein
VVDSIIDKYRDFRAGKNPDHSWGYKEGRTAIEFYTMDPAGKVRPPPATGCVVVAAASTTPRDL